MKANRRNYYRILHVQPEAPQEIIRASYRMLMGTLKMHPDFGGDHETAALINTAWAVLGDPERRADYDRTLKAGSSRTGAKAPSPGPAKQASGQPTGRPSIRALNPLNCGFCDTQKPTRTAPDTRCMSCSAPLGMPHKQDPSGRELFGRRSGPRMSRSQPLTVHVSPNTGSIQGTLRDLSINGASILVMTRLQEGQVIRLQTSDFEAVVRVVSVRSKGAIWSAGTQFLAVMFTRQKGALFSAMA